MTRTITAKLTRIYLIVALSVLVSASLVTQLYLYHNARSVAHENLKTQATALAGNLESAVAFSDARFAQQTLNALQHYPDVRMALVILSDGKYFAKYAPQGSKITENELRQCLVQGSFMTGERNVVTQAIALQGEAPARLLLIASLEKLNRETHLTVGMGTGIGALILFAAYTIFRRMSRAVTRPIEDLTILMRDVEHRGDQGQRAQIVSDDEIGELARGFNAMIHALERRTIRLNMELEERKLVEIEILATKNQLQATLDAVPDLMFELGLDGRYYAYHSPRTDLLAAPPEVLLTRTVSEVLPADVADICIAALREANENGQSTGRHFELPLPQGKRWFELSVARKEVAAGQEPRFIVLSRDITERMVAEEAIKNLAFYDPLTGLPNRRLLHDRLKQAMASSNRSGKYGAVLFIDLDNFKTLNDTLGHDVGDLLLQQVAQRLVTCVREGDTVARLGGDEFIVILEDMSENSLEAAAQAETVGEKILFTLAQTYQLAGYEYHNTPSIGVTLYTDHQGTIDDLLKRADLAMYQAKAAGRNVLRFFDPRMQEVVTSRAALEASLHEAMLKGQFLLHYQAQMDSNGRLTGSEVLLRWRHPLRGMIAPADFIPLAEETRLILPIGNWVLQTACAQLALWAKQPEMAHLKVAVNVSAQQFRQPDFVDQVLTILKNTGADPRRLELELTESLLVSDVEDVIGKMVELKTNGVCFSLDDFGTGYSSLSYLKRLPLDQLKIDQSFVRDVLVDPNDASIAKTIIALAQNLGLGVIAEGVETEPQRAFLELHGCNSYQGYYFSRPLPINGFEEFALRNSHFASVVCSG